MFFRKKFKHYFSLQRITLIPKIKLEQASSSVSLIKGLSRSSLKPDQISEIHEDVEVCEYAEVVVDSSLPSYKTSTPDKGKKRDSLEPPKEERLENESVESREVIDAEELAYLKEIEGDEILKEKLRILTFDQVDLEELILVLTGIDYQTVYRILPSFNAALTTLTSIFADQLSEAVHSRDFKSIHSTLNRIPLIVKDEIPNDIESAETLVKELEKLELYKTAIFRIKDRYFSTLKSYKKPPNVIVGVIQACYLLFGYKEHLVDTAEKVMKMLQRIGRDNSFKQLVRNFKFCRFSVKRARLAKVILDRFSEQEVKAGDSELLTIYMWAYSTCADLSTVS